MCGYLRMEQRSPEWVAIRCGRVTASRVADVVSRTKSGWGSSRANYTGELIAERLTGIPVDSFLNGAMQWGTDYEDEALAAYEMETETFISTVGFVFHPTIEMAGASPDGLVDNDGLVEIKCPNTATHVDTLLSGSIPSKYILQMQFQMRCTRRNWCDYVSYDPRMPEHLRLFVKRVERNQDKIDKLDTQISIFLVELDEKLRRLREMRQ